MVTTKQLYNTNNYERGKSDIKYFFKSVSPLNNIEKICRYFRRIMIHPDLTASVSHDEGGRVLLTQLRICVSHSYEKESLINKLHTPVTNVTDLLPVGETWSDMENISRIHIHQFHQMGINNAEVFSVDDELSLSGDENEVQGQVHADFENSEDTDSSIEDEHPVYSMIKLIEKDGEKASGNKKFYKNNSTRSYRVYDLIKI